jgi:fibro-slime domain-containing protein
MKLKPQHCAIFSVLTLALACGDDTPAPITTGGSGGGGAGGASSGGGGAGTTAGNTSAGTPAGGTSAGTPAGGGMAGTPPAGGGGMGGAAGSAGSGGGGMGGMGGTPVVPVCGNGSKEGGEACDDGGKVASDGCSATCTVETGYNCPTAGQKCVPICGDGMKLVGEACDDMNMAANDGCSATCTVEAGWDCPTAGKACVSKCGDGKLVGFELCDDMNTDPDDGCDADCEPETGFVCDVPGSPCRTLPDCTGGACTSTCGDGLVIAEACDDGNVADGDGCSATCTVEATHTCKTMAAELPAQLAIPVTYRDFIGLVAGGSTKHPDFQAFSGGDPTLGMVEDELDAGGLPVYTGVCEKGSANAGMVAICPFGAQTTSKVAFDQWYRDTTDVNLSFPGVVMLTRMGATQSYVFDGGQTFTPLTGRGWDSQGKEGVTAGKNFGFTTVLRYFFLYQGDETLAFSGDDDVWVFINNKLAVDIGGLHPKRDRSVTLGVQVSAQLGLTAGNVYEMALFHAERSPAESNFKLTLTGFLNNKSVCTAN